jgi:hypothetical protein
MMYRTTQQIKRERPTWKVGRDAKTNKGSSRKANYSRYYKESIPVFRSDGRKIGGIRKKVLFKVVRKSVHMLRKIEGWAWDEGALHQAQRLGVKKTLVIDKESGDEYWSTLENFLKNSIKIDYGHGPQRVLPIDYWRIKRPG